MYLIRKDILRKRSAFFLVVCCVYVFGLIVFETYGLAESSWKLYYWQSKIDALSYRMQILATSIVSRGQSSDVLSPVNSVPVLVYHGVLAKSDGVNVDLGTFQDQMLALKRNGYQTITLDQLYDFLTSKISLPKNSIVITFDDGRKDSYYAADPILSALGYDAVMFAIGQYSLNARNAYYMDSSEIKNMAESGTWIIGSHSWSHRDLTEVKQSDLQEEIMGSKKALEDLIQKPVEAFAFPFGDVGQDQSLSPTKKDLRDMALSAYQMSFFQYLNGKRFTQNYQLPGEIAGHYLVKRISVHPEWSGQDLIDFIQSGSPKMLPFKAAFDRTDGWVSTLWGDMRIESGHLIVEALPDSTGSAAILDGTRLWKDYQFTASLKKLQGSNFYLWARFKDDNNYVACNFGPNLIHIEEVVNGQVHVIKGSAITIPETSKMNGINVAIRVVGRNVECLNNNSVMVQTDYLDPTLDEGGIGLKVWDPLRGSSGIEVSNITVEAVPTPAPISLPPSTSASKSVPVEQATKVHP